MIEMFCLTCFPVKMTNTGFAVIGAGLPRTGTTSTMKALEELLGGPCYHMQSIPKNPGDHEHWLKIMVDETGGCGQVISDQEWIDFLSGRGFRAGVDFPVSLYYK